MRHERSALAVGAGVTTLGMGLLAAVLPAYARSIGASATLVGALLAGFGLTRLLAALPAVWLAQQVGYRRLLVGSVALTAPVAALCAVPGGIWALAALCAIEGGAAASFTAVGTAALVNAAEAGQRGRVLATYQAVTVLGTAIGPVLGGVIAQRWGLRAPFLVYAALAALAAGWLFLRLDRRQGPLPVARARQPHAGRQVWRLLVAPRLRGLWLLAFALVFTRVGAQLVGVPLLGAWRLGLSPQQIGVALSLSGLSGFVTFYPAGWVSDRYGRTALVIPGGLGMVGALALFAVSRNYTVYVSAALLLGAGSGMLGPVLSAYLADLVAPDERAAGIGLYRTISDLGATLAPATLGWLAGNSGDRIALLTAAALMLVAVSVFAALAPRPPNPVHHQTGSQRDRGG